MKRLVVTDLARRDLAEIAEFTRRKWGNRQKAHYLDALRKAFVDLLRNPEKGMARDDIRSGYRSLACEHHVIFYRLPPDVVEIVRVLHERMDMQGRL